MVKLYEHKWLSPQISFETRKSCSYVRYLLKMLAGCMILHNILKSKLLDSPLWSLHPGDMLDMYVGVPYTPTRSRITDHFYLNFMFTPWITGRYYDLDTLSRSQDEDARMAPTCVPTCYLTCQYTCHMVSLVVGFKYSALAAAGWIRNVRPWFQLKFLGYIIILIADRRLTTFLAQWLNFKLLKVLDNLVYRPSV